MIRSARGLAAAVGAVALAVFPATAAHAVASVDAVDASGAHLVAAADAETVLTVTGSGFQSIQNGFGGIYLMFGVVSGELWQPSAGGRSGVDYRYVNDDPAAPRGFQQFIAFPGSSTEAEASGGTISPDGAWQATITVPGAELEVTDSSGAVSSVDCRIERCGIITMGAHGVANANNETFTPITFEASPAATPSPSPSIESDPTAEPADTDLEAEDAGAQTPWLPVVLGASGALASLLVAGAAVLVRRRRRAGPPAN